jgi:hypothetical protein
MDSPTSIVCDKPVAGIARNPAAITNPGAHLRISPRFGAPLGALGREAETNVKLSHQATRIW